MRLGLTGLSDLHEAFLVFISHIAFARAEASQEWKPQTQTVVSLCQALNGLGHKLEDGYQNQGTFSKYTEISKIPVYK